MSRTPEQKVSDKQEARTARTYGGSVSPMSGAGWKRKADVRTDNLLIENKTSMVPSKAKSYSVKLADLRKLRGAAIMESRIPVLQFDLGHRHFVVLDEDDFLDMIEGAEEV